MGLATDIGISKFSSPLAHNSSTHDVKKGLCTEDFVAPI